MRRGHQGLILGLLVWLLTGLTLAGAQTLPVASIGSESAAPLIISSAYFDEGDTPLSLQAIQALPESAWTSFKGGFNRGYQANPHWIRLDLRGEAQEVGRWVIQFHPVWHDQLRLYDPTISPDPQVTGDRYAFSASDYRSLSLAFEVPSAPEDRSVFVRIESPHSLMVTVDAKTLLDMVHEDQVYVAGVMGYLAFLGAVLLFSLGVWAADRERVVAAYCVQLFFSAAYGASMFGIFRLLNDDLLGSQLLNQINYALIVLYPSSVLVFYRLLYVDYGLCRWAQRSLDAFIYLGLASLLWVAVGQVAFGLAWNAWVLVFASAFAAMIPWFALTEQAKSPQAVLPVWMLRTAGALLLSGVVWVLARTVFGAENDLALEGFLMHSFWLALAVAVMLHTRARRRLVYFKSAALAAQALAEEESTARKSLEQFINMLSHEIKTPLSVLGLAIEHGLADPTIKQKAVAAVGDIDQLVDRCLRMDQVASGAIQPDYQSFDVGALLQTVMLNTASPERFKVSGMREQPVVADPWLSEVVLTNLLENALKYAPTDQPIDICLGQADPEAGWVGIRVMNPMPANAHLDINQLFEKFYRAERSKRHSGAGLGLYLSKALAKIQGGDLVYNANNPELFDIDFRIPL